VLTGIPYIEVIRKVLRYGYKRVIKPAYNSGGLKTRLFSGTYLHLLRKCPVPVWLMKIPKSGKFQRILAPIDIGHDEDNELRDALSLQILELGSSLAITEFGEIHIAHAWNAVGEITLRGGHSAHEVDNYVEEEKMRHCRWVEELYQKATKHLGRDALQYLSPQLHTPKG